MSILAWIIVGLLGGLISKALMPGPQPGGLIFTILLGIAGAFVGGFLSVALGVGNGIDGFDMGTIALSALGAMLILFVYRALGGANSMRI